MALAFSSSEDLSNIIRNLSARSIVKTMPKDVVASKSNIFEQHVFVTLSYNFDPYSNSTLS